MNGNCRSIYMSLTMVSCMDMSMLSWPKHLCRQRYLALEELFLAWAKFLALQEQSLLSCFGLPGKNLEFFLFKLCSQLFSSQKGTKLAFITRAVREEEKQTRERIVMKDTANHSAAVTWPEGEVEGSLPNWDWKLHVCHSAEKTIRSFVLTVS